MRFTAKLSKYIEEDAYIDIKVIALSEGYVQTKQGKLFFSSELLKKHSNDLKGKPVLVDHKQEVLNMIGVITESNFEDNRIICILRISKTGNEKIIDLLKLDPSPITDVSIGADIIKEKIEDNVFLIKSISFKELSLVFEGADSNAKITEILLWREKMGEEVEKLTKENIDLSKEKVNLLSEIENIKLQLDVSKKEVESLKEMAEVGKKYKEHLEKEVIKFVKLVDGDKSPVLVLLQKSDIDTLKALEEQYKEKASDKYKRSSNMDKNTSEDEDLTSEKLSSMNYKELVELSKSFNSETL